jgi:hypothetical protein
MKYVFQFLIFRTDYIYVILIRLSNFYQLILLWGQFYCSLMILEKGSEGLSASSIPLKSLNRVRIACWPVVSSALQLLDSTILFFLNFY